MPSDGARVPYGVHHTCPAGIGSLVVTLAGADLPLTVTAVDGAGTPRVVARHDQVAEAGVGFTTCGVGDGETLTWTVQVGGEITQVNASYGNSDSLDQWPTDPQVTSEFWVPNTESQPATGAGSEDGSGAGAAPVAGSTQAAEQPLQAVGVPGWVPPLIRTGGEADRPPGRRRSCGHCGGHRNEPAGSWDPGRPDRHPADRR